LLKITWVVKQAYAKIFNIFALNNETMKYDNIREESIKLKVGQDFFERYDCTDINPHCSLPLKNQQISRKISRKIPYFRGIKSVNT
jgi:hypothetical protein